MNNNHFKYELTRGKWPMCESIFEPEELNWFQKMLYRIQGYKVIKITDDYWDALESRIDDNDDRKTTVTIEFSCLNDEH